MKVLLILMLLFGFMDGALSKELAIKIEKEYTAIVAIVPHEDIEAWRDMAQKATLISEDCILVGVEVASVDLVKETAICILFILDKRKVQPDGMEFKLKVVPTDS